ncbi:tetratricopeptide repeat protein [uncultured Draconibacterium sp.]|uniref:tetratricopeptide repeat protein n=1 Tax=uncultured Draconibacterium sp. TaxID=1573823 RepID=UPI0025D19D7F|nr:tetratricopeptide repeat protein [uncultured Draconibacterium sp.]
MNLKSIYFFIITFLMAAHVVAQPDVDSLKTKYTAEVSIENKVLLVTEIAKSYLNTQPDSARYYANDGLKLSEASKNYSGLFRFYNILGRIELMQQNEEAAIASYEQAIQLLDNLDNKTEAFSVVINLGYLYDLQNKYVKAFQLYSKGLELAEELNDITWLYSIYNNFGSHLKSIGDLEASKKMFHKTIAISKTLKEEELHFSPASAYSNMASIYLEEQKTDSAMLYLRQAWNYPGARNDAYGEQIMSVNFVDIFLETQQPDSVSKYLNIQKADLEILESSFPGSINFQYATYYRQLGENYYNNKQYKPALLALEKALDYSEKLDEYDIKTQVLQLLASSNEESGNMQKAAFYYKSYAESSNILNERNSGEEIIKLRAKHELDKELTEAKNELAVIKFRKDKKDMVFIIILLLSVSAALVILLLFLQQRNRHKQLQTEEALHRMEKEKVSEELDHKKKEMATNGMYLAQKNNLILLVSKKLTEIQNDLPQKDAGKIKEIIEELGSKAHDNSWEEFEKRFKEVHTDFYERLSKAYPKLTAGDLRLCGFLRLNMSNKEIAAITYQNVESLKTARYRLRKKLGLSREVNLIHFLTKF